MVLSVVVLAVLGRVPDSQAGWISCPLTADDFRPGDKWLVRQLRTQVEALAYISHLLIDNCSASRRSAEAHEASGRP